MVYRFGQTRWYNTGSEKLRFTLAETSISALLTGEADAKTITEIFMTDLAGTEGA